MQTSRVRTARHVDDESIETIPFRLHPRVFAALGSELVTNDVVAVIELVKNAYDAFATRVDVQFQDDPEHGQFIEIADNGQGMDRTTIEEAWCVVATPFREENPIVRKGKKRRRVSGQKGLGRLSAARLGKRLEMLTKAADERGWRVSVTWSSLAEATRLDECVVKIRRLEPNTFTEPGTILRIYGLVSAWDKARINEVRDNLARLIRPFATAADFEIWLKPPGESAESARIEPPEFLSFPKYSLTGEVDELGNVSCQYKFASLDGKDRVQSRKLTWPQIRKGSDNDEIQTLDRPGCGSFRFEVRAWDIGADEVKEISEHFELTKSTIRRHIGAHKGISVYRDGILVLPKSEATRDWLGLDLRRVSRVGKRMSTSQMIGSVEISADANPVLRDTSDREGLVASREVSAFEEILKSVVGDVLENERDVDRQEREHAERPLKDLLGDLSTEGLVARVEELAKAQAGAREAVPVVGEYSRRIEKARGEIERRLVYYSRLATVGTIAQMLVHEIRNQTTTIGGLVDAVAKMGVESHLPEAIRQRQKRAQSAIASLERLAETFSPLASRSFRRGKRSCPLEERIEKVAELFFAEMKQMNLRVDFRFKGRTTVAVDPGELDAVLLNLVNNAIYWLNEKDVDQRRMEFETTLVHNGNRVNVCVHDSGPGVAEEDGEKVFWPGVTRKPGGIGMGLTVASELVAEYGGKMKLICPGKLGGATFVFDLPVKK